MEGLDPQREYEARRWLGLIPHDQPTGLHGDRRIDLVARHTGAVTLVGPRNLMVADKRGKMRTVTLRGIGGASIVDALVATYPKARETQIMALLRPQPLSDRLWRWVYALMVTGGPIRLGELIAFVARLTGPRDVAEAEAVRLYQRWSARTYHDG